MSARIHLYTHVCSGPVLRTPQSLPTAIIMHREEKKNGGILFRHTYDGMAKIISTADIFFFLFLRLSIFQTVLANSWLHFVGIENNYNRILVTLFSLVIRIIRRWYFFVKYDRYVWCFKNRCKIYPPRQIVWNLRLIIAKVGIYACVSIWCTNADQVFASIK